MEELDESLRFASVFAADRIDAQRWFAAQQGVQVAPEAALALLDWFVTRLVACAHTALDEVRRQTPGLAPEALAVSVREPARWAAFLARYPVVARLVARASDCWRTNTRTFLDAIARDHERLGARPELIDVRSRAGRLAARRPTLITTLTSSCGQGDGVRWVYRVQDREMARWFQDVCAALNPSLSLPLHVRAILATPTCSWDSFVAAAPCSDAAMITRFMHRAGMLVRLAERLAAVDLHCENVLAAGEHPVLVDIETLFSATTSPGGGAALEAYLLSPIRSGLVSPPGTGEPGRPAVAKSGFHPGGRLVMPLAVPRLAPLDGTTGGFVHVYPVETVPCTTPAPLVDHVDTLLAGYDEMERVLVTHADLVGHLARAPQLPVRQLNGGGRIHDEALHLGLAPALLRAESIRDAWLASQALTPLERAAIRDLELPRELTIVGDHLATCVAPPLAPNQLARRHDLIRTTIALADDRVPVVTTPVATAPASFTARAVELGDHLLAIRFEGGDWHGAVWVPWAGTRVLQLIGPDLLSGLAGVAIAFAYLARITGLARFRDASLAAIARVPGDDPYAALGGYVGLGGTLYSLATCTRLLGATELARDARVYLKAVPARDVASASVDLVLGLSGLLLGALALGEEVASLVDAITRDRPPALLLPGGVPVFAPPPEVARAVALARAGWPVRSTVSIPLAWEPRLDLEAVARQLARLDEPALLDDVDLAMAAAYAAPADARFATALVTRAEQLVARHTRTGRWLAGTSVAERHQLSVLTGLPAVILALLAADAPGTVRSVRRLE